MRKNKRVYILILVIIILGKTFGQNNSIPIVKTAADSIQYAAGAYVGQWLSANGIKITNERLFKKGLDEKLANNRLGISDSLLNACLTQHIQTYSTERSKLEEQQLFTTIRSKQGTGILPSGVAYIIKKAGAPGKKPSAKDSVVMNVKGYLANGQVFEDSYRQKQTDNAVVGNLITGLKEALPFMDEGSNWQIVVPSSLAYGEKGMTGLIPPYSALIFEIELVKIIEK